MCGICVEMAIILWWIFFTTYSELLRWLHWISHIIWLIVSIAIFLIDSKVENKMRIESKHCVFQRMENYIHFINIQMMSHVASGKLHSTKLVAQNDKKRHDRFKINWNYAHSKSGACYSFLNFDQYSSMKFPDLIINPSCLFCGSE